MPSNSQPLVYLILGATGSGRRQILTDLIADGLEPGSRPAVLLAGGEPVDESEAKLPGLTRWTWYEGNIDASYPEDATHVFFVLNGRVNPVDQTEAFKAWLDGQGLQLGRSLCVIDCRLAEKHPSLLAWYEACIHFSDVALLNHREGVQNKWLSGFLLHFEKQFSPCLFEMVKGGQVKNPALLLDPVARRMTHVFDEELDWIVTNEEGEEIDDEDEVDEDEELQAKPEEDPYFTRRSEGGRRHKEIPDIAKFLAS